MDKQCMLGHTHVRSHCSKMTIVLSYLVRVLFCAYKRFEICEITYVTTRIRWHNHFLVKFFDEKFQWEFSFVATQLTGYDSLVLSLPTTFIRDSKVGQIVSVSFEFYLLGPSIDTQVHKYCIITRFLRQTTSIETWENDRDIPLRDPKMVAGSHWRRQQILPRHALHEHLNQPWDEISTSSSGFPKCHRIYQNQ
jgi:hypothetical protein